MGINVTLEFTVKHDYSKPKEEWAQPMPELTLRLRNYHSFDPIKYDEDGPAGYLPEFTPVCNKDGDDLDYWIVTPEKVLECVQHQLEITKKCYPNSIVYPQFVLDTIKSWLAANKGSDVEIRMTEFG